MSVSYDGYNNNFLTLKAASGTTAGAPVKITANDTAGLCSSGDAFCGISAQVRNGFVSVQTSGTATLAYTGDTAPSVGYATIAANGSGGVTVPASGGKSVLVLKVDTTGSKVTFIF